MEQACKSPADWLVDYLSKRLAEYFGRPVEEIAARIKDGKETGGLPTELWVVEHPDGTRSRELGFTRTDFFFWWMWEGLFPVHYEDQDKVWPKEVFEDRRVADLDRLSTRWQTHAGGLAPDLYGALAEVLDELAVFRWSRMDLSIGRDDFIAWYVASPISSTVSVIANTVRSVSVDELWPLPGPKGVEAEAAPWKLLAPGETVRRAAAELLPQGYLPGMGKKAVKKHLGDHIDRMGGNRPSEKTFERELQKLKANR